ncbi:MAG: peptidase M16 [Firmicutes bacterium HGW-Firmicutes-14]|nr:MAG: peptidase M16 [Firmicutes bacterium HGW-Firmicutes-14]
MYRKETLPNGVRIVTEEIPYVRSVALGIWVGAGSRDEDDSNNGIAHFIEHMMFKGTARRSAKEIAEALDAVGGQLNAFTSKEYTCYYAKVLDEHLDVAVDLLSDMFFNSLFREEDIEKEKNVIIEEIKMYEDTPDELVHDIFASTLWHGHALGRPVIGTDKIIGHLGKKELLAFREKFYSPDSLVVAAAGNIQHETVVGKLASLFGNINSLRPVRNYGVPKPNCRVSCKDKDTEQVHVCIGTPGLPMDDKNIYVLHIMNSILGGGLSSRLFQEIREERGLAYSIFTYHSSYQDAGLFSIYAGLSRNNLDEVISLISREVRDVRYNGVTGEELTRAKEQLKGNILLGLENVSNRMTRLGKSELSLNRIVTVEEAVEKINRVSLEDISDLAGELFRSENVVISSIGPGLDEKKLKVCID